MPLIIKKQHLLILGILGVIMAIVEFIRRRNMHEIVLSLGIAIYFFYSYERMRKKEREEGRQ